MEVLSNFKILLVLVNIKKKKNDYIFTPITWINRNNLKQRNFKSFKSF